jgi:hypothetical protein
MHSARPREVQKGPGGPRTRRPRAGYRVVMSHWPWRCGSRGAKGVLFGGPRRLIGCVSRGEQLPQPNNRGVAESLGGFMRRRKGWNPSDPRHRGPVPRGQRGQEALGMRSRGLADARSNGKGILCSPARYPHPIAPISVANGLSPCALPDRYKRHATMATVATSRFTRYPKSAVVQPNQTALKTRIRRRALRSGLRLTLGMLGCCAVVGSVCFVPLW